MFTKAKNWLADSVIESDELVAPSNENLHFAGDTRQKTLIGGILSLFVTGYMIQMGWKRGVKMVDFDNSYLSSVTSTFEMEDDADDPLFVDMSVPMLEILNGSMDDTVELTRKTRAYIHISAAHI